MGKINKMRKARKLLKNPKLFFKDMFENKRIKHGTDEKKIIANKAIVPKKRINKTAEEYLKELTDFAAFFDVNCFKYKDEYLWPYLRQHFWVQLYLLGLGNKSGKDLISTRLQLGSHGHLPDFARNRFKREIGAIEIEDIPIQSETDFLFLTVINASEQVELEDGSIYFRITDPVFEAASKVGSATKLEMIKVNSNAVRKVHRYKFKPLCVLPPSILTSGYTYEVTYHPEFLSLLSSRLPSLMIDKKRVDNVINWELHTKGYYKRILERINPKVLFVNGFHYHAPLLSAAQELNIVTVDIQHGIQIGWNPLYNNWNEMPKEGYRGVPDKFLVWGDSEFNHINKVFKSKNHEAILGGFPWLEKQFDYYPDISPKWLKEIDKYNSVYLIVLQNQTEVPLLYKELISKLGSNILWIVRHHPKGKRFTKEDFGAKVSSNLIIDPYFDKISLARLLKKCTACFSEGSTVSIEADYFGVVNFISSKEGYENYVNQIKKGHFFFIKNVNDYFSVVNKIDFSNKKSRTNEFSKVNLEEVMYKMLHDAREENNL